MPPSRRLEGLAPPAPRWALPPRASSGSAPAPCNHAVMESRSEDTSRKSLKTSRYVACIGSAGASSKAGAGAVAGAAAGMAAGAGAGAATGAACTVIGCKVICGAGAGCCAPGPEAAKTA